MSSKLLPLGSICVLKKNENKVLLIGYGKNNDKPNMKDYIGCEYPKGLLLSDKLYFFYHLDILDIVYEGYKDYKLEEEEIAEYHKQNDMFLTSSDSYSKLLFDENGVVMISDLDESPKKNKYFSSINFDKYGNVIGVSETKKVENPFHKNYSSINDSKKNSENWNIFKNLEFDADGTVIDDGIKKLHKIQFDENGNIENIRFSEDGVVLADGTEKDVPPIGPGLPGYVAPVPKQEQPKPSAPIQVGGYTFGPDGTVLAAPQQAPTNQTTGALTNIQFDENGIVLSD